QLDQLLAAQPLKIASAHPTKESAKSDPRKGVGNYGDHDLGDCRVRPLHRAPTQRDVDRALNRTVFLESLKS
ncbi:hypothetical protein, partial [Methylobacterium sp. BTF04]|uniref:hypothetical protein n=1 Tax=Methylobacterium sp. BTF04 TaxID=2708300 RepID=UPI001954B85B